MVSKRGGKRRKAAPPSDAPAQVSREQALAAVDERRDAILAHAATVSPARLFNWLREDLLLPDAAALLPHRRAVKHRALALLEEQGQIPGADQPAAACDLPTDVLAAVLRQLDHDSLFCALSACKAWRAAGAAAAGGGGGLWEAQCAARGWVHAAQGQAAVGAAACGAAAAAAEGAAAAAAGAAAGGAAAVGEGTAADIAGAAAAGGGARLRAQQQAVTNQLHRKPNCQMDTAEQQPEQQQLDSQQQPPRQQQAVEWREHYRQQYGRCCYDCFLPTNRHTLEAGSVRLRLCRECWSGYESPSPQHRLVAASHAKRRFCLKDQDLELLPRCVEPNPVSPSFDPMRLFRKLDVRRVAVERWGSWEAVQAEHRRRITRS